MFSKAKIFFSNLLREFEKFLFQLENPLSIESTFDEYAWMINNRMAELMVRLGSIYTTFHIILFYIFPAHGPAGTSLLLLRLVNCIMFYMLFFYVRLIKKMRIYSHLLHYGAYIILVLSGMVVFTLSAEKAATPYLYVFFHYPVILVIFMMRVWERILCHFTLSSTLYLCYYYSQPTISDESYFHTGIHNTIMLGLASIILGEFFRQLLHRTYMQKRQMIEQVQKLQELDVLKDRFVATVSHELRTPLNVMLGLSEELMKKERSTQDRYTLYTINKAGNELLNLINDILDFAKIRAGYMTLNEEPTDLRRMIFQVVGFFCQAAKDKGLVIEAEIDIDFPNAVMIDPVRIKQIILNLVSNAIKFTSTGTVQVNLNKLGESKLQLIVSDTGIGIPNDQQQSIFKEFYQFRKEAINSQHGTGLGLSIVSKLVEAMDGSIVIRNNVPKGTIFVVELPLLITHQIPQQATSSDALMIRDEPSIEMKIHEPEIFGALAGHSISAQKSNVDAQRILIADDHKPSRYLMYTYLNETNVIIDFAENGKEALLKLQKGHYHLIILDINLPEMSGEEVIQHYRRWEDEQSLTPLPIFAVTATTGKDVEKRLLSLGFTRYIAKPVLKQSLLEAMVEHGICLTTTQVVPQAPPLTMKLQLPQELLQLFAVSMDSLVGELMEAIESRDFKKMMRIGHNIKGTGGSYGLPRFSEIGARIEEAAESNFLEELRVLHGIFRCEVDVLLKKTLGELPEIEFTI